MIAVGGSVKITKSTDVNKGATENLWCNLPHSKPNLLYLHQIL